MNQQQIEKYVAGRMSEEEARAFEDHFVAHPELARQVEIEQRLKAGFQHVARGSTAEFVRSSRPFRWQMAAMAAGIALSIFALLYAWNHFAPHAERPVLAAVSARDAGARTLRLALVRGNDRIPTLNSGLVRVEIAGLFDPDSHYSVALDRIDQRKAIETVANLHGVRPSSPVALAVLIDGDQLPQGSYSLHVRKQTSVDEPLDFEFQRH